MPTVATFQTTLAFAVALLTGYISTLSPTYRASSSGSDSGKRLARAFHMINVASVVVVVVACVVANVVVAEGFLVAFAAVALLIMQRCLRRSHRSCRWLS